MSRHAQRLGQRGEALVSQALEERGALILARNVRTPCGELDIVARQGGLWVLIEVKARGSRTFGPPEESLIATQQAHLIASAQYFLAANEQLEADRPIDGVAIEFGLGGETARLEIIEDSVRGDRSPAAQPAHA